MTLYIIGIGLSTEKDISVKGLEIIKQCDKIYLENYTSLLQCSIQDLEKLYGKKIITANREFTEQHTEEIVAEAKTKNIAFLVIGDPFSATTHVDLFKLAKEKNIPVEVINNASVLTAVGITGLQLYKFGKVTSIPFIEDLPKLETPYLVLKENQKMGLHTLFLLDLKPNEHRYMTLPMAIAILEKIQKRKHGKILSEKTIVVGCARVGSASAVIKAGTLQEIKEADFGKPPHCLIIPGKLHFLEEEMLQLWMVR